MTSKLVSIVLPTYNRADRLEKAVQSCLAQTYTNLELIVVDAKEGSTDSTVEMIKQIQAGDSRLLYLRQHNTTLPDALNRGFQASKGDLLTWTSDDNTYGGDAFAIMVQALEDSPDVGMVYCDYDDYNDAGEFVRRVSLDEPHCLTKYNCIGQCHLYRREVYEKVGDWDTKLFLAEDFDYWLRIHKHFKIKHLKEYAPYQYGLHEGSLTSTRRYDVGIAAAGALMKNADGIQKIPTYFYTRKIVAEGAIVSGRFIPALWTSLLYTVSHPWDKLGWIFILRSLYAPIKKVRRRLQGHG